MTELSTGRFSFTSRGSRFGASGDTFLVPRDPGFSRVGPTVVVRAFHPQGHLQVQGDGRATAATSSFKAGGRKGAGSGDGVPADPVLEDDVPSSSADWNLAGPTSFSLSRIRLSATPWSVARQAPLPMGFSRQEHWSGLPSLSPGYLPDPGIEPRSPALQVRSLPPELLGKPEKSLPTYKGGQKA